MLEQLITRICQRLMGPGNFNAEVLEVDKEANTCMVQEEDKPIKFDVRLCSVEDSLSTKIVVYPKVGSIVMCSSINRSATENYISKYGEIDEVLVKIGETGALLNAEGVVLNDGALGGLVKIEPLIERINRLEERMGSHQHLSAPPGNPTAPDPATNAPLIQTQRSELENEKVKH